MKCTAFCGEHMKTVHFFKKNALSIFVYFIIAELRIVL